MDTSEMRELLQGYLSEMSWAGGATKDDVMAHLAGRDEALRTMVNQFVAEGTYRGPGEVLNVIPAQAWQDVQGDAWRGAESQYAADTESHFGEGAVGRSGGVYRAGATAPPTPGFGHTRAEAAGSGGANGGLGTSGGQGTAGSAGSNAGEVDLGVAGGEMSAGSVG